MTELLEPRSRDPIRDIRLSRAAEDIVHFTYWVQDKDDTPDTLIFLDKSARPISWGFRAAWRHIRPDEKMPANKFVNIGREKLPKPAYLLPEDYIENSIVENDYLRLYFSEQDGTFTEKRRSVILPDTKVLVVDDIEETRTTQNLALTALRKTFPEAAFDSTTVLSGIPYWWGDSGLVAVEDIDSDDFRSKGVEDKAQSKELRQDISRLVLDYLVAHSDKY